MEKFGCVSMLNMRVSTLNFQARSVCNLKIQPFDLKTTAVLNMLETFASAELDRMWKLRNVESLAPCTRELHSSMQVATRVGDEVMSLRDKMFESLTGPRH